MSELRAQLSRHAGEADPSQENFDNPEAAPGEKALLDTGILYQANWKEIADGMCRHAREAALALATTGVGVCLRSISETGVMMDAESDPAVWEAVGHLNRTSIADAALGIRQLVLENPEFLKAIIAPKGARLFGDNDETRFLMEKYIYRSTVVYTSWERSTVSQPIIDVLSRVGQVWVPCKRNALVFAEVAAKYGKKISVRVVPCPYDPNGSISKLAAPRGSEDVPSGRRFYQIGKWEPRKNQHALLGAFLTAFSPKERASLMLKTAAFGSWKDYPSPEQSVEHWLSDPAVIATGWTKKSFQSRVRIITQKISEEDILGIHRTNNIYVSASHGEAWDLPAFDAKCIGNRLVYVPYGGPEDYAGPDDISTKWAVDREVLMQPVDESYGWEPDAQWARASVADLADAMRRAEPPRRRIHPPWLAGKFSRTAVGLQMVSFLADLAMDLKPGLWADVERAGGFG